jgi:hypothetical protein
MHAINKSRKEGERWTWEKARGLNAGARPLFRLPGKIQSRNLPLPAAYVPERPSQKIKITKRTHFVMWNCPITTTTYARDVQNRKEKRTHLAPISRLPNPRSPSFRAIPTRAAGLLIPYSEFVRCSAFVVRCSMFPKPLRSLCLRGKIILKTVNQGESNPIKATKKNCMNLPPTNYPNPKVALPLPIA